MAKNNQNLGVFCALLANIIFGFSFIFSKLALSVSHPLIILSVRFTIAFLVLNLLLVCRVFKISTKVFKNPTIWLMGLAQPLLYFIFELYGLSLVSSALSGIIISLVPVAVMLFSTILREEKPFKLQWFFTLLSVVGVSAISILSNNGEKSFVLGVFLLIGAVICAAVFNILSRRFSNSATPFERTYIMFLIGFIGFNITAILALKKQYLPLVVQSITDIKFIVAIVYLAIISSVAAFMLYNFATSKITAVQASSFSNIITVVTVLAGVLILKEQLSFLEYILCGLIILGVWGVNKFAVNTTKLKK